MSQWSWSMYGPGICLEGLDKTTKTPRWCSSWDSNQEPLDYRLRVLLLCQHVQYQRFWLILILLKYLHTFYNLSKCFFFQFVYMNFIALKLSCLFRFSLCKSLFLCNHAVCIHQVYEKRLMSTDPHVETLSSDPLEFHRDWGHQFLQKVRQRVLKQCHLAQQHRQLQDIVIEDQVPDIG